MTIELTRDQARKILTAFDIWKSEYGPLESETLETIAVVEAAIEKSRPDDSVVNQEIEAIAQLVEQAEELVERYPPDGHVDVSGTLANIADAIRARKQ